jgi:hypothetical protein
MSDHAKCKNAACHPVLQIRGEMGAGDYFGVMKADGLTPDTDHHKTVELTDANRNDCRIACKTCALATPWAIKDAPGMPNVGVAFSQTQWAAAVAAKVQKSDMLDALRAQFGDEAIETHFRFSL